MNGQKFGNFFLVVVLVLLAVQYVLCGKGDSVDFEGNYLDGESVENVFDDIRTEYENSSFRAILDIFEEEDEVQSEGLEEPPKNSSQIFESKSTKKGSVISSAGGGGHGGTAGPGGSAGGRKKRKGQKKQQSLVQRIMPIMIIPFMISTAIIPLMIFVIKLLFIKAAFVAKVAVTLGLISFFRRKPNGGGVHNYNAWKMR